MLRAIVSVGILCALAHGQVPAQHSSVVAGCVGSYCKYMSSGGQDGGKTGNMPAFSKQFVKSYASDFKKYIDRNESAIHKYKSMGDQNSKHTSQGGDHDQHDQYVQKYAGYYQSQGSGSQAKPEAQNGPQQQAVAMAAPGPQDNAFPTIANTFVVVAGICASATLGGLVYLAHRVWRWRVSQDDDYMYVLA